MTLLPIITFPPFLSNNPKLRSLDSQFLPSSPRRFRSSHHIAPISAATPCTPSPNTIGWLEFARNVSGEWNGYGAEFSIDGNPIELPENVVPEAFREWEVKVFDWQTQCPTHAEPTPSVSYKLIKLLPTVGCDSDSATPYIIQERIIADTNVSAFAYDSTGCYVAVWPVKEDGPRLQELEYCLVNPKNKESRVRILQSVSLGNKNKMTLQKIEVFCEHRIHNGHAFASTNAITGSEVFRAWQQDHAAKATFESSQPNVFQELSDERCDARKSSRRDEEGVVLLPKQLWCSLKEVECGESCGEVGWVFDDGHALTSRCIFSSNAKLKEVEMARETSQIMLV